jgi:hypothetical protein
MQKRMECQKKNPKNRTSLRSRKLTIQYLWKGNEISMLERQLDSHVFATLITSYRIINE